MDEPTPGSDLAAAPDHCIRQHVRLTTWPDARWSVRMGGVLVEFPGAAHHDGTIRGDRYELRNTIDGELFDGGMLEGEKVLVALRELADDDLQRLARQVWALAIECLGAWHRQLRRDHEESQRR